MKKIESMKMETLLKGYGYDFYLERFRRAYPGMHLHIPDGMSIRDICKCIADTRAFRKKVAASNVVANFYTSPDSLYGVGEGEVLTFPALHERTSFVYASVWIDEKKGMCKAYLRIDGLVYDEFMAKPSIRETLEYQITDTYNDHYYAGYSWSLYLDSEELPIAFEEFQKLLKEVTVLGNLVLVDVPEPDEDAWV